MEQPEYNEVFWVFKSENILRFAQTEDIWLESALEGKKGVSLITGRKR